MTKTELINFIKEQRHIFGVCPCCSNVFRLSDVKISYKIKYAPDWFDVVEAKEQKLETAKERFDEMKKQMSKKAVDEARRKELPKLLNRAVPLFAKRGINPQDVKTILHPIDFIVFDGMNLLDKVKEVLFVDSPAITLEHKKLQDSIKEAIKQGAYSWNTLRVTEDGHIEVEE